jgi:hypothetical protein
MTVQDEITTGRVILWTSEIEQPSKKFNGVVHMRAANTRNASHWRIDTRLTIQNSIRFHLASHRQREITEVPTHLLFKFRVNMTNGWSEFDYHFTPEFGRNMVLHELPPRFMQNISR